MSRERSLHYRVRFAIGQACIPLLALVRRREVRAVDAQLATFRSLCSEWHRLADMDYTAGVPHDAPDGAGHVAYERMEAECARLDAVEMPDAERWYGFVQHGGMSMSSFRGTYGTLAHASCLHGWMRSFVPVTRREWYFVNGWKYAPPLTDAECASLHRMTEAMERMGSSHWHDTTLPNGLQANVCVADKAYFTELVANLHEIDAEKPE